MEHPENSSFSKFMAARTAWTEGSEGSVLPEACPAAVHVPPAELTKPGDERSAGTHRRSNAGLLALAGAQGELRAHREA